MVLFWFFSFRTQSQTVVDNCSHDWFSLQAQPRKNLIQKRISTYIIYCKHMLIRSCMWIFLNSVVIVEPLSYFFYLRFKHLFFSCHQLRVGNPVPHGQVMEWCSLFQLKAHFNVSLACWMRPSMLTLLSILLRELSVLTRQFFLQVRLFSRACSITTSRKKSPPQSTYKIW
jgi:hypothetical protein